MTSVDFKLWVGRVVGWDGLLPIAISTAAIGIALLFPRERGIQTAALLVLPIGAFFYRARVGFRQIRGNRCSGYIRGLQLFALGFALLLLIFFDFIIVLMAFIRQGQRIPPPEDIPIWAGMLCTYIALVVFAMYPGRCLTGRCD